ncbi:MAG: cytidylate kinase family protein [Oscillospiraceae bacterium]|nr:cytidylate kinase family protein [Oscillospiraceae bacterium]
MRSQKAKSTRSTFLTYLVPSMLGMALMAVYTFTDTFVVGQKLGSVALGAMGICTPIITITYALGFLFGMGGGALYSIEMGKKNTAKANGIFSASLLMLLALGAALAVLGNIFAEPFARFLGAEDANLDYVMPYLRCAVTYIPGFMYDVFIMSYIKNDGHPNVAMAAVVTGTGLNIVLDFIFVFVFEWGMLGAAVATCIGSFVGLAINTGYAAIKRLNIIFRLKNVLYSEMPRIVRSGVSVFILECSSGIVTFVFINRAVSLYGTMGSSAYTIIMNWTLICFNLIMGVAQSVQPLIIAISREFGSGGRTIGRIIAEQMGVPVYDKSIGELTQVESGYDSDVIDTMEDRENGGFTYGLYSHNHYVPMRNKIFQAQSGVLLSLAAKGSCVMIGRCADYVLRDKYKVVSVFIHAPLEKRAERVMEYDKCSYKEAVRKIKESDKAREDYHDFYTDIKWGRSQSYDMTVDSSIGFEKAAKLIIELAEDKA